MEKWGMFEFNSPYFGEIIEKINERGIAKRLHRIDEKT